MVSAHVVQTIGQVLIGHLILGILFFQLMHMLHHCLKLSLHRLVRDHFQKINNLMILKTNQIRIYRKLIVGPTTNTKLQLYGITIRVQVKGRTEQGKCENKTSQVTYKIRGLTFEITLKIRCGIFRRHSDVCVHANFQMKEIRKLNDRNHLELNKIMIGVLIVIVKIKEV